MDKETAAEYLSISPRFLSQLVASKTVTTRKVSDRTIRFHIDQLDAYIESLPSGQTGKEKEARRPKLGVG